MIDNNTTTPRTPEEFFSAVGGRFFFAKWMKKDGTVRHGAFRLGVQAHTKGGTLPYNPKDYRLQLVWEPAKCKGKDKGYRMVYIPQVLELRSGKLRYSFTTSPAFSKVIADWTEIDTSSDNKQEYHHDED